MRIVIPGGSGQVGRVLSRAFVARGDEVVVLTRGSAAPPGTRPVWWDGRSVGAEARSVLDGADVVIGLAGRSVDCRYTRANRAAILHSRVDATRALGRALAELDRPPGVWLQASTATIYAHTLGAPHDERTGVLGGDEPGVPDTWRFSIEVARAWEHAALEAPVPAGTRLVLMRSAITLSPDRGGIFDTLLRLVRFGVGGAAAGGRQHVSWIHHADFVRAVDHLIADDALSGPVNLASPHPLPQRAFMRALREAAGVPVGLPATRPVLEAAALLLRKETELILKSRRVVPGLLTERGFTFEHPRWPAAARDLVAGRA